MYVGNCQVALEDARKLADVLGVSENEIVVPEFLLTGFEGVPAPDVELDDSDSSKWWHPVLWLPESHRIRFDKESVSDTVNATIYVFRIHLQLMSAGLQRTGGSGDFQLVDVRRLVPVHEDLTFDSVAKAVDGRLAESTKQYDGLDGFMWAMQGGAEQLLNSVRQASKDRSG